MESTIARLLNAFEQGTMNRRQLIRSLAIAATGAHALRAAGPLQAATSATDAGSVAGVGPAPANATHFKTLSLDHISYQVADYGRSRDFYVDLMGWEVMNDDGKSQAQLRIGDAGTIIVRNSRRPLSIAGRPGRPSATSLIDHIAWQIDGFDGDAVGEELERRGLNPRRDQGGPDMDYDSYHILDPDGWDLQISKGQANAG